MMLVPTSASLRFSAVAVALALAGCELGTTPMSQVSLAIGEDRIVITDLGFPAFEITYRISNLRDSPIYVQACSDHYGVAIQRWESGQWQRFVSSLCASFVRPDTIELAAGTEVFSTARGFQPGRYRLALPFGAAPGEVGADSAFSDAFEAQARR